MQLKEKFPSALIIVFLFILASGCFLRPSKRKLEKLRAACEQGKQEDRIVSVSLEKFTFYEIDTIQLTITKGDSLVKRQFIYTDIYSVSGWAVLHQEFFINMPVPDVNYEYTILIPGYSPYVIKHIQYGFVTLGINGGKIYRCKLNSYELNGVTYSGPHMHHMEIKNK